MIKGHAQRSASLSAAQPPEILPLQHCCCRVQDHSVPHLLTSLSIEAMDSKALSPHAMASSVPLSIADANELSSNSGILLQVAFSHTMSTGKGCCAIHALTDHSSYQPCISYSILELCVLDVSLLHLCYDNIRVVYAGHRCIVVQDHVKLQRGIAYPNLEIPASKISGASTAKGRLCGLAATYLKHRLPARYKWNNDVL